jgi:homocitrate synthase NifV
MGEYSGVRGFRNVYERLEIEFANDESAREILELVRYANVLKQKPLVADELRFIAKHPAQVKKLLTLVP